MHEEIFFKNTIYEYKTEVLCQLTELYTLKPLASSDTNSFSLNSDT